MFLCVSKWFMLDSSSNSFPYTRTFVSYLYGRVSLIASPEIFSQIIHMDFSVARVEFGDFICNDFPDIRSFKFKTYGKYHVPFS